MAKSIAGINVRDKFDFETAVKLITDDLLELRNAENRKVSEHTIKHIKKQISYSGGVYMHQMSGLGIRMYVSEQAFIKFNNNKNLIVPFENVTWERQPSLLDDPGRKIFHLEHMLPRSQFVDILCNIKDINTESIRTVLHKASVAWITKDERDKLDNYFDQNTEKKARSYRICPLNICKDAGIEFAYQVYNGQKTKVESHPEECTCCKI